jgi:putative ABC transport system permease protein
MTMNAFAQVIAVTAVHLRALPQRVGSSLVIVIGIAGVVAVLISMLSMSAGLRQTLGNGARDDRAIILTRGAEGESLSTMSRTDVAALENLPGIRRTADARPTLSAEVLALASVAKKSDGSDAFVSLRGVGKSAFAVRPEIHLVAGRMYRPGEREVIVGRAAQAQFANLDPGSRITLGDGDWTVVGIFESQGSLHESTLMADAEAVLAAYHRNAFNSATVLLDSPQSFADLSRALASLPASALAARRENEYSASQSRALHRLLELIAWLIGTIMAVGAVFGALNTMYSAVSERGTEIATLRALGFSGTSVVVSLLIEAQLLAMVGACVGVLLAQVFFDGQSVSTVGDTVGHNPQIVFSLSIGAGIVAASVAMACLIGLVGGIFPAVRAARMPVATALRGA